MEYYVIHRNPAHPSLPQSNWAIDGPFDRKYSAEFHADRCEYAAYGIEFRVVNEDELAEELGLDVEEENEEEE